MKTRKSFLGWGMLAPAMCMLTLGIPAIAQQPTITTIDVPHAGTISGYGTEAIAICPTGQIAGFYAGYSNAIHAYVRATDGTITTFDAPGAGTGAGAIPLPGTNPGTYAIAGDACGLVAGYFIDSRDVAHGYLRGVDGTLTVFDVPHAGTGPGQGTFAGNMSLSGEVIAGQYVDATGMNHGFLRAAQRHRHRVRCPSRCHRPWSGHDDCLGPVRQPGWRDDGRLL